MYVNSKDVNKSKERHAKGPNEKSLAGNSATVHTSKGHEQCKVSWLVVPLRFFFRDHLFNVNPQLALSPKRECLSFHRNQNYPET